MIYNWKSYFYDRTNATNINFTYLNSALPANEECPPNKHQCGILDDLGNKLCYPKNIECPINHITLDKSIINENYSSYIVDNVTIYYTNKAETYGRVLGGFFVDSDLNINYELGDCQIISTGKISEILNSHQNKLYRNSIKIDPYKETNIDEKGKAYLKWCIPGHGKEKDISLIKELIPKYNDSKKHNELVNPTKKYAKLAYFINLAACIIIFIPIKIFFPFIEKISSDKKKGICIFILFILAILTLSFGEIFIVFTITNLCEHIKIDLYKNDIKSLLILSSIESIIIIALVVIRIFFFKSYVLDIRRNNYIFDKTRNNYSDKKVSKDNNTVELTKKSDETTFNTCNSINTPFTPNDMQ